jgi:phospholipase A1
MRFSVLISLMLLPLAAAAESARPADCVAIANDAKRLRCYDAAHGRAAASSGAAPLANVRKTDGQSIWEQRILDDANRETFTLTAYRPSYLLYSRMSTPNQAPFRNSPAGDRLRNNEMKLYLSVHTKVADDLMQNNGDLWIAYAQTSYWQAFNDAISNPFRETNHEPEAYLSFLTDYRLPGMTLRNINVGVVHQSNGQSRPLSRSWDRVFAELQLVRGQLGVSFKPWIRIPESAGNDDNPDIEDYLGRYELRASYEHRRHLFSAMLRNVFDGDKRYNTELSWSYPIAGRLRAVLQWYSGYGESLIDYRHKQNRIGIGLLMSDWL